ncbi:MAG: NUDIX domain-containing protein [Candidatus Paceibacterota bacterium]
MTDINFENNRLLDVVNEDDQIIDSKPRKDVHRLGLLHREIHVWMFDENKNIFFQKRGLHRTSPGLLDVTIGGHVNVGENYNEAAVREAKEETGISLSASDLVFLKKFRGTNTTGDPINRINNFIRISYIYKYPIKEGQINKEVGIPGGGFQKLSINFLQSPDKEYINMFHKFMFNNELPYVLEYLK